ncbi:hypothetical protein FG379_002314 [Cryptosporidium bovis]|uniref:uncharacterized protein n=1 Tax=Cryptosporidium bovis TaxID=310047 RepID=UPI00351A0D89|nr:hypothetical protein FG379_002314 [Cryptosporidium bovis]
MGNLISNHAINDSCEYFDEIILENQYSLRSERVNPDFNFKGTSDHKFKNLVKTISEVEKLLVLLMDMKDHTKRIIKKYNSLSSLFENIQCDVCFLDFAQRWVYQEDCNKLYKCCIELEARIAEQSESLRRKYVIFCDFAKLNCFREFDEIPLKNIQMFIDYPGLTTATLLERKCPKCNESRALSHSQAGVSLTLIVLPYK